MSLLKLTSVVLATLTGVRAASQNAIGSKGTYTIDTNGFTLQLDTANQVATALTSKAGPNAGNEPFNFLLSTNGRTDDGYYALGDIQIRMRPQNTNTWIDLASHNARKPVTVTPGPGGNNGVLTSADITASLGSNLPITVNRTWSRDQDSIVMTFNITNVGNTALQMGGVGIPMPYNDNWVGKDQAGTWTTSVVSDAAVSRDAGYVLTNRLTGNAPTLITTPVERTPLEQYRLNYVTQPDYPLQWLDKTPLDFNYEGVFSWWMATLGLGDLDEAAARDLGFTRGNEVNTPTDFLLQPRQSRIVGLRFHTSAGPRYVEQRLPAFGRPTIVGVPGFVASSNEQVKMIIRSTSAPSISNVSPANINFAGVQTVSQGVYSVTGTVNSGAYGQTRVTINFANGEVGTAHYNLINAAATQLDNLGAFRFSKQWFSNTSDYFGRAPGIITYDNKKQQQVVDSDRAWIAGLSDEAGTGAYVSAAAKQLSRPKKSEIAMLEQFAAKTLFGRLQVSTPGNTYGGVKKSLFYYDPALEGRGVYTPGIDHGGTWRKEEADKLSRSYNYPHPSVVYWTLYRLARNNVGLTTMPWTWYLDRAYDTIIGMRNNAGIGGDGYSQFGLMEGSYFLQILLDHEREGATNTTLSNRANDIRAFMKQRADIWKGETYPYASEFPWDNTAQEEVYLWSNYFGNTDTALKTIETLMAVMSSVPHWGYSGTGRDLWDFMYSAQPGPGARLERIFHHYKGAQSAYPLINQFMAYPTDIVMLRAGWGGVAGPLTSIGADGFGSTGFHTRPDYLSWDPYSGDNGVNIALHALSTRAIAVNDATIGGWAGFGAAVSTNGNVVTIRPNDSSRQRVFIADNALYMELDAGYFRSVTYDTSSKVVTVVLEANDGFTPNARLRSSTTAKTASSGTYRISGTYKTERGASVIPLGSGTTTVTLNRL
ncbi:hypothetical protein Slin15195_G038540 [Septoria linicola]|uniref:Uncharacterized protein n=1 Tax=Septoria linicola TaxID=215465 RepID=A0A9Q9EH08_9PEZI|nr:hypothetical protein Slin14017_G119950 [Septoria linicola]USW50535.1 hypothetical protein Slin15195_G038540 [Septoria linicola]